MVPGILCAGSLMLTEIGRTLDNGGKQRRPLALAQTEKRLSRNLLSPRLDDDALRNALWRETDPLSLANNGRGLVVAVDYTDMAKPFARPHRPKGMEYACNCRDGSKSSQETKVGKGYPVALFNLKLPDGRNLPLHQHVFSYDAPEFAKISEPEVFRREMSVVAPHVGKLAWWVLDRGFENHRNFDHLDALKVRWGIRVKVGKTVAHPIMVFVNEQKTDVRTVAMTRTSERRAIVTREHGKKRVRHCVEWHHVRLSDQKKRAKPRGGDRTLVTVRRLDTKKGEQAEPLTILASEWIGTEQHALEVFDAYRARWKVEEVTRAQKDSRRWGVRLEDFRSLKMVGIRRLVLLAQAIYIFLAKLGKPEDGGVAAEVVRAVKRVGKAPTDWTYVLFRAVSELLSRVRRRQV